MADKVQLIKEEIERLKHNTPNAYDLSRFMLLEEIESFINSLPEEPKKQPKFRVGDTIKGPCNNVFQVKEVLDTQYLLHSENGDELNSIEIVDRYSCISEEPANEDLEEEIKKYFDGWWFHMGVITPDDYFADLDDMNNIARHFAEWSRKQIVKDAINGIMDCDDDNEWIEITDKLIVTPSKAGKKVKFIVVKED